MSSGSDAMMEHIRNVLRKHLARKVAANAAAAAIPGPLDDDYSFSFPGLTREQIANNRGTVALDGRIVRLCHVYADGDDLMRAAIRSRVRPSLAESLLSFSMRRALRGIGGLGSTSVFEAAVALAVEDCKTDARETVQALAVVWEAAKRCNMSPDSCLFNVASMATAKTAELIHGFASRSDEQKRMDAFGFKLLDTPDGTLLVSVFQR